jgi:signal transduction histidine kinase
VFILFATMKELPNIQLDAVHVNDITKTFAEHWDNIQHEKIFPALNYQLDYAVIDNDGNLITTTRRGLNETINSAIKNRDTIVDIVVDENIAGKIIFYNDTAQILKQDRTILLCRLIIIFIFMMMIFAAYTFYLHVSILRPFRKMKKYAEHIAAGNFDFPLKMDKHNLFGAFTESFDLMREELHKAKENERKADRSKKELVMSLSHDIKTPIASIKAVAELMLITTTNDKHKKQLAIINVKADQINSLITDMFHSVLEELNELNVAAAEVQSGELSELICNADYKKLVKSFSIPNCIVSADLLRLQQIFDNIIGNSYKYAGTEIEISAAFVEQFLSIEIIDFGKGVPKEELPLLFNKFYRGKDTETKSGYGLGLFIAKHLLEKMSGNIQCKNLDNGFSVQVNLRLG